MENKYEQDKPNSEEGNNNNKKDTKASSEQNQSQTNPNTDQADWNTIEQDPTKINIESNLGDLASGTFQFIKSTLSLRHGNYNYRKVVAATKENVLFEGYNVWILICSIVVASIGLDMDSVAVVIGAMLISPLMGPIRGIGFGVGMNDLPLLISSFKNFGVMIAISLVTSIIYFLLSPVDIANSQLLGRTEPNFLDAMIAFFGGLAGIIAASNGKNDTVINGVAIATALMPPLCTAGWGIANAEWTYFLGASYLFLLNSLFIALSTVVLIRYLRFPKIEYISDRIERKVKIYMFVFFTVIIAPSGYLFYKMAKRSSFESSANLFVEKVVKTTEDHIMVTPKPIFDLDGSVLELAFVNTYIDSTTIGYWNRMKVDYDLEDVELQIIQGEDQLALMDKKVKDALGLSGNQNELINMLKEKELLIANMQQDFETFKLKEERKKDKLDLNKILKKFNELYTEVDNMAINRSFTFKNNQLDTNYIITVRFNKNLEPIEEQRLKSQINKEFCYELKEQTNIKLDSVSIVNF